MRIISTADVSLDSVRELANDLGTELPTEVDESQIFMRSTEPPSWVSLLADADVWVKLLGAYAALFVAELVKEAAKDTWRNRGKAVAGAGAILVRGQLRRLATAIAALRKRLSQRTSIGVGLPVPNDYFSTRLALEGGDPDLLCAQLALFVHHLPAISALVEEHGLAEGGAATGLFLALQDDGSILVSWHDPKTLEIRRKILSLEAPV